MKRGGSGSKQKGAAFERKTCLELSHWVSCGARRDLFWRSAMSGGRATIAFRTEGAAHQQAGDISSVASLGHSLTDLFFIECKFYKRLQVDQMCVSGKGLLASFWLKTVADARDHDRSPMLIARQNNYPTLMLTQPRALKGVVSNLQLIPYVYVKQSVIECEIRRLDTVLAQMYLTQGG